MTLAAGPFGGAQQDAGRACSVIRGPVRGGTSEALVLRFAAFIARCIPSRAHAVADSAASVRRLGRA